MNYSNPKNLKKLTALAYSLTCITGVAVILPFILKASAAKYFDTTLGTTGFVFSMFMFGMLITEFINGHIVKYIQVKHELFAACALFTLCVIGMFVIHNIYVFGALLFLCGLCFGAIVHIPNMLIVHAFPVKQRSSKLNRLDFFFSLGSFVYPMVASWMLLHQYSWQMVYASVIILVVFICGLASIVVFPNMNETSSNDDSEEGTQFSKWNLNVYLVFTMLIAYFLSYITFTYWVVDYLTTDLNMDKTAASFALSLFWIFYGIGCAISSWAVQYIKVDKYIMISAIVSLISYILVFYSLNVLMMYVSLALLGLGCSTLYSSNMSYGTMQVKKPSPRLVSFFLFGSGAATMIAESGSSFIESHFGLRVILMVSAGFMLLAIVVHGVTMSRQKT